MTFKLYDDKSSVLKKNTRYLQGGTVDILPNALGWWEKRIDINSDITDIEFTITPTFNLRPDKVTYLFYQRNDLMWLVLQYNNIVDINSEFITGKILLIPSPSRAFSEILINPVRYQAR